MSASKPRTGQSQEGFGRLNLSKKGPKCKGRVDGEFAHELTLGGEFDELAGLGRV